VTARAPARGEDARPQGRCSLVGEVVRNDLEFVRGIVAFLDGHGVETLIFGGWAEELHGLCSERAHGDLDLLYPAEDFGCIDALVRAGELSEIRGKRFPHKRAFIVDGLAIEIFLVQDDAGGPYTVFWGDVRHDWPPAGHEVI
jgi:hypothetical protein